MYIKKDTHFDLIAYSIQEVLILYWSTYRLYLLHVCPEVISMLFF